MDYPGDSTKAKREHRVRCVGAPWRSLRKRRCSMTPARLCLCACAGGHSGAWCKETPNLAQLGNIHTYAHRSPVLLTSPPRAGAHDAG